MDFLLCVQIVTVQSCVSSVFSSTSWAYSGGRAVANISSRPFAVVLRAREVRELVNVSNSSCLFD